MASRSEIHQAVNVLLNDVIEQSFGHLVRHPQQSDELNRIIKEASEDLNYFLLKIDAHQHIHHSDGIKAHYEGITKEVQRKSLHLLARLQQIQRKDQINTSDEKPSGPSSERHSPF